jgi:RecB family exonuclease
MSRDNRIEIKAGGSVTMDAVAVGDHARAASIRSAQSEQLAAQFLEIRGIFDRLETSGALPPAEATLLKDETADIEQSAQAALQDEAAKDTLVAKLKRFGMSVRTFCKEQEANGVFAALETVASLCAIPLALLGFPAA